MAYEVHVTVAAEEDLDGILAYLINVLQNRSAASKFYMTFLEQIETLRGQPLMYELARDSLLRQKGYRKIVIGNYIVLYSVDVTNNIIHIARVFYGKQKYEDRV